MDQSEAIRQLLAERRALVEKLEALNKEDRQLTPEEQASWDALTQQVADLDARVTSLEESSAAPSAVQQNSASLEGIEKRLNGLMEKLESASAGRRTAPAFVRDLGDKQANRDRVTALRGWLLGHQAGDEHRAAAQRARLNLASNNLTVRLGGVEERDNSTSNTAGGYTIPQGFLAELEKKLVLFNPLRSVARVIRTESGNALPIPTIDDTSNSAAQGSENTAVTAVDLTFGQVTLNAYRYESLVLASNELLRDSGIDIAGEIGALLGERVGRKEAAEFATGSGSSAAQGIVTGSSAGVTAASATAIAINDVIGLVNSVDAAYQPNGAFMMHQSIWAALLKLQDSTGRPLVSDYINGNQPKLLGYPVILNNNMASTIATTNKTILFGDFSKYYIREVGQLELIRLNERYAEKYQTGFMVVGFRDAKVVQSAAIKRLTQA